MQLINTFLKDYALLEDKEEANELIRKTAHYVLQNEVLYERWFSSPLFWYAGGKETNYVLREVHE